MQIDDENCACSRLGEQGVQLDSKVSDYLALGLTSAAAPPRAKAANAKDELFCAAALSSVQRGKIFAPAGTTSGIRIARGSTISGSKLQLGRRGPA